MTAKATSIAEAKGAMRAAYETYKALAQAAIAQFWRSPPVRGGGGGNP